MRFNLIHIVLVAMLLGWTGLTVAAEEGEHICFRHVDADQDGIVTFAEFSVHYGQDELKFKTVDADGDGQLTHDEYHAALGHGAAEK